MAGIEIVGRDSFGVFPLKGKFMNVRNADSRTIMKNEEVSNLIKILGLRMGVEYTQQSKNKELRYG